MKQTIIDLKKLTGHSSDTKFAEFLGVTKNTIARAKARHRTKLNTLLPILLYLLSKLSESELKKFMAKYGIDQPSKISQSSDSMSD